MKFLKSFLKMIIFLIILILLIYIGVFIYAKVSPKLPIKSANSYYMYDMDSKLFNGTNSNWVKLDDISPYLIDATLSAEDKNFYKHFGFDILRIMKAMYTNILNKDNLQGASTITQQFAKNLFLTFDKTWNRKLIEAILTIRLEAHYSKDTILEGYLNTINYGGVFGINTASQYYFNKDAKDLNLEEAAILAGIPKSPSNYSPLSNYENSKKRQKTILNLMVKNKYITEKEATDAYKKELIFKSNEENQESTISKYFEDAVMNELRNINTIPPSLIETGGLKIYTTFDSNANNILNKNISKYITDDNLEIASVLMDPSSGEIKAIAGGKDFSKSEYNRVTQSVRQVGSTIKPILYYAALENGFTPSSIFTSEKTTFNLSDKKTYSPKNYNDIYANKPISMPAAIAYSDNIYAIKTHIFLGEDTLVNTAKKIGINNLKKNISSALGTDEVNILDMIEAYSTFANLGYSVKPHFIRKVLDMDGNVLYKYKSEKKEVLDKSTTFILNELLTSSYDSNLLDYNTPTCLMIAPKMSRKYAIKTGTTDTDHLIFGYNKNAILGIWMGYDDNRLVDVKVGNAMKHLWIDTMEEYQKDDKDTWYSVPDNVEGVIINPITGKLATKDDKKVKLLYYIKGTGPIN
ncbi:MAG: PBP1A family penicillin-binding protein [Bacilli bacterium]|nr:PBP1A family penicillin-binding protein [Bacilli bacterium]